MKVARGAALGGLLVLALHSGCRREESAPADSARARGSAGCRAGIMETGLRGVRRDLTVGGEVRSFHALLTRARQEAVLRVMEQAAQRGFDAVCNLRLEAVDISGESMSGTKNRRGPGVYLGLIAYGMAYKRAPGVYPPAAPPTLLDYPQ